MQKEYCWFQSYKCAELLGIAKESATVTQDVEHIMCKYVCTLKSGCVTNVLVWPKGENSQFSNVRVSFSKLRPRKQSPLTSPFFLVGAISTSYFLVGEARLCHGAKYSEVAHFNPMQWPEISNIGTLYLTQAVKCIPSGLY